MSLRKEISKRIWLGRGMLPDMTAKFIINKVLDSLLDEIPIHAENLPEWLLDAIKKLKREA